MLGSPVWQSIQFSGEDARRTMVGTLTTLLNLYAFYSSNANAYGYTGQEAPNRTHDLDRWVISRLNSTIDEVRGGFDTLEVHRAVSAITLFVEDLSNWYVRRSRRRFWVESDPEDRFSAHSTLHECLLTLARLMAPVSPFISDWLYTNLKGPEGSVHLDGFPQVDRESINNKLESNMALVRQAVDAGRAARQGANVKLRQPLGEAIIAGGADGAWTLRRYERMIAEELNVKHVEVIESREAMIEFSVAPNLKTLGPKLKEGAAEVSHLLEKVDGDELARHLRTKGRVRLGGFDLFEEDVVISERQKSGYAYASIGEVHVYVSLGVDKRLKIEGLAREVIRRIQHMRKEMGLEFEDAIEIEFRSHPEIEIAVAAYKPHISQETHAKTIVKNDGLEGGTRWTVNKMPLELSIRKA
jgi:isoleucyl-tRNA synthetase